MGFSSKKVFTEDPALIFAAADQVASQFRIEGYEVKTEKLIAGGAEISITKGGFFRAVSGMKTALKISLRPDGENIIAEAGIGIFGQQAVPTVISMLFFWPVLLTQVWGLVQQYQLDDHAMELIGNSLQQLASSGTGSASIGSFCPECGAAASGNFCSSCGKKLN